MKRILINTCVVLALIGCESTKEDNQTPTQNQKTADNIYNSKHKSNTKFIFEDRESSDNSNNKQSKQYDYIPTGTNLTQEMAYRFLNMTTFGATPELAQELRKKGVIAWVNEQLNMKYNYNSESTVLQSLKWMQKLQPNYLNEYYPEEEIKIKEEGGEIDVEPYSIEEIVQKNDIILRKYNKYEQIYVQSSILNNMVYDKAQLRQRVAYALSQILIASESVDRFFRYRFTALASYYDILLKDAFEPYNKLLYDVSMTPAMATFMTYNNNQKTHKNHGQTITPDENYGREIMQRFTIGLYKLSIDGMEYSSGNNFKQNYTQDDVNTMSRVFTGLSRRRFERGWAIYYSDVFNPIECNTKYHDIEQKEIFGKTIPANQSCENDVKSAIDILVNHDSAAPFISKKLIMRLTKSNPKNAYIERVAKVFQDNGKGITGDLRSVIKAILLDKDIWEDIKNSNMTKIREPWIAYTNALRLFDVKPMSSFKTHIRDSNMVVNNTKLFTDQIFFKKNNFYEIFAQAPLQSPTVFNFYADQFVPNSNEFRLYNHVAPELEIQTNRVLANFSHALSDLFDVQDRAQAKYRYGFEADDEANYLPKIYQRTSKFTVDTSMIFKKILEEFKTLDQIPIYTDTNAKKAYMKIVEIVTDEVSKRVLGKKLSNRKKELIIKHLSDPAHVKALNSTKKRAIYTQIINPVIRYIFISEDYRVN